MLKQETPLRLGRLDKNVVVVLQKNMTRLLRLDEESVNKQYQHYHLNNMFKEFDEFDDFKPVGETVKVNKDLGKAQDWQMYMQL